jgi:uncharacterized protein YjbJ (UPF0337 family)
MVEIKNRGAAYASLVKLEDRAVFREPQAEAVRVLNQVTGAVMEAFGNIVESGSADQMRGYANETLGKAKVAVALAVQSPDLAKAGIAQQVIGEVQKFVGEAKKTNDNEQLDGDNT